MIANRYVSALHTRGRSTTTRSCTASSFTLFPRSRPLPIPMRSRMLMADQGDRSAVLYLRRFPYAVLPVVADGASWIGNLARPRTATLGRRVISRCESDESRGSNVVSAISVSSLASAEPTQK
jgi:hypothetical protein